MLRTFFIPGERIVDEEISGDTDDTDTDSVSSASIGDIGESTPDSDILPSSRTRSAAGKGKKTKKETQQPYDRGVVYLPGDIMGLAKKLHLLAADFFAGNTKLTDELVHVLDALLRLKQLTRKEYADIAARLAASL